MKGGGRLLGHDAGSGRETLNLKLAVGGFADLSKVQGHQLLISAFRVSRSWSAPCRINPPLNGTAVIRYTTPAMASSAHGNTVPSVDPGSGASDL